MNEILNGHGLGFDWSGLVNSLIKTGGDIATTAITAKNGGQSTGGNYDFNNNSNTNTNGSGGTVVVQQQDKTLLYIGVGALALMAIFMITNSGRRK